MSFMTAKGEQVDPTTLHGDPYGVTVADWRAAILAVMHDPELDRAEAMRLVTVLSDLFESARVFA